MSLNSTRGVFGNSMKQICRVIPVILLLLSQSCIGDDYSNCPPEPSVTLEFNFTYHPDNGCLFMQEVDTLSVLLYNDDDSFTAHYRLAQDRLVNGNTLALSGIADGDYTVVTWAKDKNNDYRMLDYNITKQALHTDVLYPTGKVDDSIGNLFHAMTRLSVRSGRGYESLDMTRNTRRITVYLSDRTATPLSPVTENSYSVEISAPNGCYRYDNTLTEGQPCLDYAQAYTVTAFDTLQSRGMMLRLYPDDDSNIQIKDNAGNIIPMFDRDNNPVQSPASLSGQIMLSPSINTQEDLDRGDAFVLSYVINRDDTTGELNVILMSINDWMVCPGNPGI